MPIRFQVDSDFYDHPKVLSMSDAAFALWVRAGSYCAAKRTDGFVADDVLSLFSETQRAAAPELVRRRLWTRVKSGYRFHQFDERNLLKARDDADRAYDRDRKQRQRKQAREKEKTQVGTGNVPVGHPPDIRPESGRSPDRSVSVSVSGSESSKNTPRKRGKVTDDDPHFAEFWGAYPRAVDKGHARKAWAARIGAGADPRAIIDGAVRYRDDPRRPREAKFIPHPSTWLNGERWTDSTTVTPPAPSLFADDRWWEN